MKAFFAGYDLFSLMLGALLTLLGHSPKVNFVPNAEVADFEKQAFKNAAPLQRRVRHRCMSYSEPSHVRR